MPLRFFVKTAITVVTPPVVFHSFPLPVTHVFFFAVLLQNQGGITVIIIMLNHGGVIADMAIPLSYHCGLMAVPRRSLAAGLRCWRQHCGASEVPLRGWR